MKACHRCKGQNPDGANYCRYCGFPLERDRELILKKAISSFEGAYRQMIQELEEKNKKIEELSRLCRSDVNIGSQANTVHYLDAVELGLSVDWASCNLGAESPEEFGNYYAWGEISPKEEYCWATYRYSDASGKRFSKYNMSAGYYVEKELNNNDSGYYLMNTPCLDSSPSALVLTIEKTSFDIKRYNRYSGFSIRPVKQ